jgi:FdhD protein
MAERVTGFSSQTAEETLAVEEPLEIQLGYGAAESRAVKSISVTMRTPGYDFELAAGFLMTEGVVRDVNDIERIAYAGVGNIDESAENSTAQGVLPYQPWKNIVRVELAPGVTGQPAKPAAQLLHHIELRHLRKGVVAGIAVRLPSAQEQSVFNQH